MNKPAFRCFATAAALSLLIDPTPAWSEKRFLTEVQALDEDQMGVAADVIRIYGDGRQEWLAKTNDKGIATFAPAITCDFNHRIRVRPDAPLRYQQPDYQNCGKTLSFVVKRWIELRQAITDLPDRQIVESLWKQAETLKGDSNSGSLALVYTELSNRLAWISSPLVKQLREQAYLYVEKDLKIENALAFDIAQEASVMSPRMIEALENYQRGEEIAPTGRLDRVTLQTLAGKPYAYYLYEYARPLAIGGPDRELQPSEIAEATELLGNLEANAKLATSRNDHDLALLLHAEMAQRYWQIGKVKEGRAAEHKSYELAADILNVRDGTTYDPVQDKYVMSENLVGAIRGYQHDHGLPVTGRLDYRTIQRMSGKTLAPYLYRRID